MTGIELLAASALGAVPSLVKRLRHRRVDAELELQRILAIQRIDQIRAQAINDLLDAERRYRAEDVIDSTCEEDQ